MKRELFDDIAGCIDSIELKTLTGMAAVLSACGQFEPAKYSLLWLRSLSDEMLDSEREVVRLQYCKAENLSEYRITRALLDKFDRESSRRYALRNPRPISKPGYRWTYANRWEK